MLWDARSCLNLMFEQPSLWYHAGGRRGTQGHFIIANWEYKPRYSSADHRQGQGKGSACLLLRGANDRLLKRPMLIPPGPGGGGSPCYCMDTVAWWERLVTAGKWEKSRLPMRPPLIPRWWGEGGISSSPLVGSESPRSHVGSPGTTKWGGFSSPGQHVSPSSNTTLAGMGTSLPPGKGVSLGSPLVLCWSEWEWGHSFFFSFFFSVLVRYWQITLGLLWWFYIRMYYEMTNIIRLVSTSITSQLPFFFFCICVWREYLRLTS